mmetsp:Transcript_95304/g.246804  ORF Transcript_95304/g.246804 Transcript_95304/m.246804 type:complete len:328 (-) Transcript_95304:649-1632(-)
MPTSLPLLVGLHPHQLLPRLFARVRPDLLEALLAARDHVHNVATPREQNTECAPNLRSRTRKDDFILWLSVLPERLPDGSGGQRVAMHHADLPVLLKPRDDVATAVVDPLGLVQVRETKISHPCIVGVAHCLQDHLENRFPMRAHKVEMRRHWQAPSCALRTTELVPLNACRIKQIPATKGPYKIEGLQRYHPPSDLVLVRGKVWREPWQMEHGVQAMPVSKEHRLQLALGLVQHLAVEIVRGRVDSAAQVIPDGAEKAVVELILGVVQRVVGGRVDEVLHRSQLHPRRDGLEVAVSDAVQHVEENKVNGDQPVRENAEPSRQQKRE